MISTWTDTGPAWLGGIGGILSVIIAAYALFRAIRSEALHVEWQLSNERRTDGRRTEAWRLVNTTSGVSARVIGFEDISDGLRDALRGDVPLPADVDPGGWLPFNHSRSMASPYPTIVRVTWQEGRSHGWIRRRKYVSTLYVD
jgi:hypothetical protein